jgi:hypothetical protein
MDTLKQLLEFNNNPDHTKIKLEPIAVRNKKLNDVLLTKSARGGKHYSPKTDFNRADQKRRNQRERTKEEFI